MSIVPFFYQHFHDLSGKLAAAGRMHVYVAGSTIHKDIWADAAMSVPRDNPMTLDGNGVAPQWFVGDGLVDIKVYTSTNSLIFTALNVSGAAASGQLPWGDPTTGFLYFNEETGVYSWTDAPGDHKVKTHDADAPGFLSQKLLSNNAIHWELVDLDGGEFGLNPVLNESVVTGDHKVLADAEDDTAGYLDSKIESSATVTLEVDPVSHKMKANVVLDAVPGDHKVAVDGDDDAPGYLAEKVTTRTPDYLDVGLSAAGDALSLDILKAPPAGPAGGDLFGTYPDPRVKELTGVPSMLVIKDVPFNWLNPNVPPYSHYLWAAGAGIGFGSGYVGGTKRKCWMACSQLGELWVSYDNFQTTVNTAYIELPYFNILRYAGIYHVKLPGTSDYYWIFTANNGRLSLKDVPSNFNSDGTPIVANMQTITFNNSADINAMAFSDSILVVVGNGTSIRYAEAADISVSGEALTINLHVAVASGSFGGGVPSAVTGGIGFSGDRFIVDERDTGNLFTSTNGKTWFHLGIGSCEYQDGTEVLGTVVSDGVSFGNLPVSNAGYIVNKWSSILYVNDVWVICNAQLYTGTAPDWLNYEAWTPYVFSYDGVNWNAYQPTKEELAGSPSFKASFYKAAYGDGLILATNQNPDQAADGQPAIYQMLIDEIAAHRRLIAEKGLTVAGTTYFLDLPGASALGTDSSGKVIPVPGGTDDHKVLATAAEALAGAGFLQEKLVDSLGVPFSTFTLPSGILAVMIPTGQIAGTPNAQALFDYSLYETKNTIAQDGSNSGNASGNRGFAFIATASRVMSKARIFIAQSGGNWIRMGLYDSNGTLLAKSNRIAVVPGLLWCPFITPAAVVGGERYYLAYWCDDTTGNIKFGCLSGRNTESDAPQAQLFDTNNEMPTNLGTSGARTGYRPWMMISE